MRKDNEAYQNHLHHNMPIDEKAEYMDNQYEEDFHHTEELSKKD